MKIKSIKRIERPEKVYNLRIKSDDGNNHSYIANDVVVSNCHQTKTASIKNIIEKCKDSEYRFGLSGTVQEDNSADFSTIVALLGPMVKSIPPRYLFQEGYATPVNFKIIVLEYQNNEMKSKLYDVRRSKQMEGSQILALEKKVILSSRARFLFIMNLVAKTTKNTLLLFSNVKDQYGKRMYDWLRENTDKTCYYVDGSVGREHRDFYKKEMETGGREIPMTFLTFNGKEMEFRSDKKLLLSNGEYKLAGDITLDDDIDDNFLKTCSTGIDI